MFSGSVVWNNVLGGECSLVLSCRTFSEEGNVLWFCPVERSVRRGMSTGCSCPVERFVRKGMFSGSVLWNVL